MCFLYKITKWYAKVKKGDNMKFGDRLRELLELHNLSQKQLGERLNIAPSTIGNYVRNIREPDHSTLIVFADYFNVSVDFLLGNSSNSKLCHNEQLLLTIYSGLNSNYQKILLEEAKLLFELQDK